MRLAEQRLWDVMKGHAPRGVWLQRIENVVAAGMPDVLACAAPGTTSWIELKAVSEPPVRPATPLLGNGGLNPAQVAWHTKAASLGIRTFVLVRVRSDELYLVPGRHALGINAECRLGLAWVSVARSWAEVFARITMKLNNPEEAR